MILWFLRYKTLKVYSWFYWIKKIFMHSVSQNKLEKLLFNIWMMNSSQYCSDNHKKLCNKYYAKIRIKRLWCTTGICAMISNWKVDDVDNVLFSDGAYFYVDGTVYTRTAYVWSKENLRMYIEKPLHYEKVFVRKN